MSPDERLKEVVDRYLALMQRPNEALPSSADDVVQHYRNPVLTPAHVPPHWRYDFDVTTNAQMIESWSVTAITSGGAIWFDGMFYLVVSMAGSDEREVCALVTSPNGIDRWRFVDAVDLGASQVSHLRLTRHTDGWIYGTFRAAPVSGLVRTKDLRTWERLSIPKGAGDLVLHPTFIDGRYAWYRSTTDGVQWLESDTVADPMWRNARHMESARLQAVGAPPVPTSSGWLQVMIGVADSVDRPLPVIDAILTAPDQPWRVVHTAPQPIIVGGRFQPVGSVKTNGLIVDASGRLKIYYTHADWQLCVVTAALDDVAALCQSRDGIDAKTSTISSCADLPLRNQRVMDELGISY